MAEALAAIGQRSARAPLAEHWASERYQNARVALGDALVRLGAKQELLGPLVRFLGTPDPLPGGLDLARRAGILDQIGGPKAADLARIEAGAENGVLIKLAVWREGNGAGRRVLVRARVTDGRTGQVRVGAPLGDILEIDPHTAATLDIASGSGSTEAYATLPDAGHVVEASHDPVLKSSRARTDEVRLIVAASPNVAIEALAVVPFADEVPPPPPEPWHAPAEPSDPGLRAPH